MAQRIAAAMFLASLMVCIGFASESAFLQGQGIKEKEESKSKTTSEETNKDELATPAEASETIGLLSGLYLYQTYLNIGLLADGKAKGVYPALDSKVLLGSILTPLDRVDKQLERYLKASLSKEDQEASTKVRAIVVLLREQGKHLQSFWESEKEDVGAKYENARKEAWTAISKFTGIESP